MELTYLGHSSFRMKFKSGMVLVTDPFDPKYVGLPFFKQKGDLVTVSHGHSDHNFVAGVAEAVKREEVFVIDEEGEYEVGGVEVTAIKTYHDSNDGKDRGENLVMVVRSNGITLCHMGDLGHKLSEKQIEGIGPIDVLLLPVGGVYTMGPKEASELVASMSPSLAVPMHFKVKGMKNEFAKLKEVSEFLDKSSLEVMLKGVNKIKIDANTLPENTKLVVLDS